MSNPRTVFIDVAIQQLSPNLKFTITPSPLNDPQLPTGPNGEIIFDNDHHDGFDIYFMLQGNTFGYLFPDDEDDAVWSQCGNVCPKTVKIHDVFKPKRVINPGNRVLVVKNKNPNPAQGKFQYNLRVTNGTKWEDLDPGGDNKNGPSDLMSLNYAAIAAIGATTGILSALATTAALARFDLVCGSPGF